MRKLKKFKSKFGLGLRKTLAIKLVLAMLLQLVNPVRLFALTGGPSQPEVQSFEPVGTSDMVDLFSGDFNYNIPLLDVEGYPVNISYHSGITMDQEASWVGLGWNINPGVINRSMRGLPDDFNGDPVTKEFNMKPNKTFGLKGSLGFELFGLPNLGASVGIGVHYNNYNGIGIEESLNLSLNLSPSASSPLTCGLGIGVTSSSDDGLSIQPSLSFSAGIKTKTNSEVSLGLSVGTCYNSRGGLRQLTIGASLSTSAKEQRTNSETNKKEESNLAGSHEIGSSSFDFGMPTYSPSAGLPMQNLSITGNFRLGGAFAGAFANVTVGGYYSGQQLATNYVTNPAYGYMNSDQAVNMDNALYDFNREKDGNFTPNTPALPVTNFTYDIFSVSGQGVSGSYRPFRGDLGHVYDPKCKTTSDGYSIGAEVGIGWIFHAGLDVTLNDVTTTTQDWIDDNAAGSNLTFQKKTGNALYENYYFKEANEKSVDTDPAFFASAGGENPVSIKLDNNSTFSTITDGSYSEGGGPSANVRAARDQRSQPMSVVSRGDLDSFALSPPDVNLLPVDNNDPGKAKTHHMAEMSIHKTDGSRYVYGIAAYNTRQEETTFAVGLNS
ncbi:MAG TPA: hypothetical protein VFC34_09175, partial [Puia sp.]|nr:hypothetical protein [Puia sp.]